MNPSVCGDAMVRTFKQEKSVHLKCSVKQFFSLHLYVQNKKAPKEMLFKLIIILN